MKTSYYKTGIVLLALLMFSCSNQIVDHEKIQDVTVIKSIPIIKEENGSASVMTEKRYLIAKLTDSKEIERLGVMLNNSYQTPGKWIYDYKLEIVMSDGVKTILVKDDMFKSKGLTFKSEENIGELLKRHF